MKIDVNYGAATNKEFVQKWYLDRGQRYGSMSVGMMANATTVPCINVAYWIGEVSGWPDWIISCIKTNIEFYGYTEIINKPEGAPI